MPHSFVLNFRLLSCSASPLQLPETVEVIAPALDTFVFSTAVSLVAIQVSVSPMSGSSARPDEKAPVCCGRSAVDAANGSVPHSSRKAGTEAQSMEGREPPVCHVPTISCTASGDDSDCGSSTPSSLLVGHVHCYVSCPDILDETRDQGQCSFLLTLTTGVVLAGY